VGVDVGRFKSEFLAGYWQRHGTPASARLLGNARSAATWGSRFASLSNWALSSRAGKGALRRVAGIDSRRQLPRFARRTLEDQVRERGVANAGPPDAYLFLDTFTNYYNPEVGLAALNVLGAAGVRCDLASHGCCGRPQMSKGLLQEARTMAARNASELLRCAESGRPILFCEPSCLSAVKEDAPALLRGEDRKRAEVVAGAAMLFEQFMADASRSVTLNPARGRLLLHGHCHQKSMGLVGAARSMLARIPGADIVDIDAGCCGMAGSFGYASDHYEVSRAIGERRLFPAVRAAAPDDVVVAAGTSCRHQVYDFTGRQAVHPAVLLQSLLPQPPS
jgi:Fe-S oxidoreductase